MSFSKGTAVSYTTRKGRTHHGEVCDASKSPTYMVFFSLIGTPFPVHKNNLNPSTKSVPPCPRASRMKSGIGDVMAELPGSDFDTSLSVEQIDALFEAAEE